MISSATYWRNNKAWSQYLGQRGRVVGSTYIQVAPPEFASNSPYSYVIVEFESGKKEMMGVGHQLLKIGDEVECVLRKSGQPSEEGLIPYMIKVRKVEAK